MFTDEELDTLNSAIEIVSRYIDKGLVDRDALNSFERMIVSIIDGDKDEKDKATRTQISPEDGQPIPTTKWRINDSLFDRNLVLEKQYGIDDLRLYGYFTDTNSMEIVGEIIAQTPKKPFCMICSLYDKDGDIIETTECSSYGSGLVTSMIYPNAFFSGFPFKFSFWSIQRRKMKRISITPADSY